MKTIRLSKLVLPTVIALATLGAGVSPAIAESPNAAPSRTVRFGDLNLSSSEGRATLYRRIQNAAADVCGPAVEPGARKVSQAYQDCVSEAVHRAVRQVNRPELTADHMSKIVPHVFTAWR